MKIAAVIMASGMSKRMKKDKLILKLKSKRIFEYTIDTVKKSSFFDSIVITNNQEIIDYCNLIDMKTLNNLNYSKGQSESIRLGTKYFYDYDAICFFVCDQPLLNYKTVNKLVKNYTKDKIYALKKENRKGNPVIFGKIFFDELLSLKDDEKGTLVKNNNLDKIVYIECDNLYELLDIDTENDYERILNERTMFD